MTGGLTETAEQAGPQGEAHLHLTERLQGARSPPSLQPPGGQGWGTASAQPDAPSGPPGVWLALLTA